MNKPGGQGEPRSGKTAERVKQQTPSRRLVLGNSMFLLVALNGTSYLTTFIRERFFYQREYGTHVLDHLEVLMSALAIVSNIAGLVLTFLWVAGRLRGVVALRCLALLIVIAAIAALKSRPAGEALGIAISSALFLTACQRAAANGRQAYALLGAVTSVGPTLFVWEILGTRTAASVLTGYLAGTLWQALVATLAGNRATALPTAGGSSSAAWPLLYTAAIQVDGLIDQVVLLRAGAGWAGSDALAYNFFAAAVVIIVSPMSSQAMAGRLRLRDQKRVFPIGLGVAIAFVILVSFALPAIVEGGALSGTGIGRLRDLSITYGAAVPFATYWHFHTRVAHRQASTWRITALTSLVLFTVHLVVLVPLVVFRLWVLVPIGTAVSFSVVAGLWAAGVLRPDQSMGLSGAMARS